MESGDGLVLDWLLKAVGGSRCDMLYFLLHYLLTGVGGHDHVLKIIQKRGSSP